MADADYQRLAPACPCGRPLKVFVSSGRIAKSCTAGCRPPPDWKCERTCAFCGCTFSPSKQVQTFCSRRCRVSHNSSRKELKEIRCQCCGVDFTQSNPLAIYCGKSCTRKAWQLKRDPTLQDVPIAERFGVVAARVAQAQRQAAARAEQQARHSAVSALIVALGRVVRLKRAQCRREALAAARCVECGCSFSRTSLGQVLCGLQCSRARHRRSASGRAARRAWRAASKALLKARTVERFDPFDVFERDGWRCQICGVSTPQRLRGSFKPNAPEIDHIVALSLGGEHSKANTQCACRRCNGAKSNGRPVGQMGLFV